MTSLAMLLLAPLAWAETQPDAPAPLQESARRMNLPLGFQVSLFAGEPDVRQPIAFTLDHRGRLWVVECYSYPSWGKTGKDRIVILSDKDGDGRADERRIFFEGGANFTGIELGFGGVWVCATPYLLFIPDRDGDDRPDGPPAVELDGWDLKCQHNAFNALRWGPDGWLYGCNGILSNSRPGRPGTPDAEREPINCGVWRYHPQRKTFEGVAWGTTNPWGLDFDDEGEIFITNCVIPHLFHVVPGAHFQRMYGQDFNPYLFQLLESCADHIHWAGGMWQDSRGGKGKHGEAGGGHAHAGCMVYLGGAWPAEYRNSVLMCNIHGNRVNRDLLQPAGSGYNAAHARDFLLANDEWFRGLELKYGPDGDVFLTDWSDTGECHENDAHGAHHDSGRIYKIHHGPPAPAGPAPLDLAALGDAELAALQLRENDWHVRASRRLLQERAAAGRDMSRASEALKRIFLEHPEPSRKLRAFWALRCIGALGEDFLAAQLRHELPAIRSWAIRFLCEDRSAGAARIETLAAMARREPSPRVRLHLASALQRLPVESRRDIAAALLAHGEDAADRTLPLLLWYGIEPLVAADRRRGLEMASRCEIPLVRRFIFRRALMADGSGAAGIAAAGEALRDAVRMFAAGGDAARQEDFLRGAIAGLRGRQDLQPPEGWPAVYAELLRSPAAETGWQATLLALLFRDGAAIQRLLAVLGDGARPASDRLRALEVLVENRVAGMPDRLAKLFDEPPLRAASIRALAAFPDDRVAGWLLGRYASLSAEERIDAIGALASRAATAAALLDAVEKGAVPRRDISAFTVRQLLALQEVGIQKQLERVWGAVRPTSKEKAALAAKYKSQLTPESLKSADLSRGRAVFNRTCSQCHRLFDAGGDAGPDLTGSNRANLDYILENVLDPSAAIGREYKLTTVRTRDQRFIPGIIKEDSGSTVTVQTANERVVIPRAEIAQTTVSEVSMMPENILDPLSAEELRDLIAYLAAAAQAPLPPAGSP